MTIHEFGDLGQTFCSISHLYTILIVPHLPEPYSCKPLDLFLSLIDLGWRGSDIALIHM